MDRRSEGWPAPAGPAQGPKRAQKGVQKGVKKGPFWHLRFFGILQRFDPFLGVKTTFLTQKWGHFGTPFLRVLAGPVQKGSKSNVFKVPPGPALSRFGQDRQKGVKKGVIWSSLFGAPDGPKSDPFLDP